MSHVNIVKPRIYDGCYIVATCLFIALVTNGTRRSFGVFEV